MSDEFIIINDTVVSTGKGKTRNWKIARRGRVVGVKGDFVIVEWNGNGVKAYMKRNEVKKVPKKEGVEYAR